jgi:hypothetical protein
VRVVNKLMKISTSNTPNTIHPNRFILIRIDKK